MTSFTPEQKAELSKPLNPAFVKQRSQAGRELSYIEGWHAIAEANRLFGFDGWDRETIDLRLLGEPREEGGKQRVAYMARVRIQVHPNIFREGCGFGSGIDRDLGRAHESALKEAETDAMKRALMTFGNQFGLALYDKEQRGVGVEVEVPEAKPDGTDDPDWAPIAVSSGTGENRKSAYQARKDGRWEPLVASLRACPDVASLIHWSDYHAEELAELPAGWVASLREEWKARAHEIKAEATP